MVLHQARVAVVGAAGGVDADAAGRLLHDDGEDEAVVDTSLRRDLLDTVIDGTL